MLVDKLIALIREARKTRTESSDFMEVNEDEFAALRLVSELEAWDRLLSVTDFFD